MENGEGIWYLLKSDTKSVGKKRRYKTNKQTNKQTMKTESVKEGFE